MKKSISKYFDKMNCRLNYDIIKRMQEGKKYEIIEEKACNGKMCKTIFVDEGIDENDALIEFLENYLKAGDLHPRTEKNLKNKIKQLEKESMESFELINNTNVQEFIEFNSKDIGVNEGENEYMMHLNIDKYPYKSNAYEIEDIISFVIKVRIEKRSPFSLLNEFDFPPGTIHTFYKGSNELRILFVLYTMSIRKINKFFENISKEKILSFNKELKDDVKNCSDITDEIKEVYLNNIEKYRESIEYRDSEEKIDKTNEKRKNDRLIKVITETEEIWNAYININKEKIFKIIYDDPEILNLILDKIYD